MIQVRDRTQDAIDKFVQSMKEKKQLEMENKRVAVQDRFKNLISAAAATGDRRTGLEYLQKSFMEDPELAEFAKHMAANPTAEEQASDAIFGAQKRSIDTGDRNSDFLITDSKISEPVQMARETGRVVGPEAERNALLIGTQQQVTADQGADNKRADTDMRFKHSDRSRRTNSEIDNNSKRTNAYVGATESTRGVNKAREGHIRTQTQILQNPEARVAALPSTHSAVLAVKTAEQNVMKLEQAYANAGASKKSTALETLNRAKQELAAKQRQLQEAERAFQQRLDARDTTPDEAPLPEGVVRNESGELELE
jgi:hypothetical protein